MTDNEKNELYAYFRRRLLDELVLLATDENELTAVLRLLRRAKAQGELAAVVLEPVESHRICGCCGIRDIPYSAFWEWWHEGKPVHPGCLWKMRQPR